MAEDQNINIKKYTIAWFLLGLVILLSSGYVFEKTSKEPVAGLKLAQSFQEELFIKQAILDKVLVKTIDLSDTLRENQNYFKNFDKSLFRLYDVHGISLFIYKGNKLMLWTDNLVPVPGDLNLFPEGRIVSIGNSAFYIERKEKNEISVIGLIWIRTENPYENRFLQNGYQKDFRVPAEADIIYSEEENLFPVRDRDGEFLFSFDFYNIPRESPLLKGLSVGCYVAFFFLFLIFIRYIVHKRAGFYRNYLVIMFSLFVIVLIKGLSLIRFPKIVFDLDLFSPVKYSGSYIFSTIGDIYAGIFILFFITYSFYVDFRISYRSLRKSNSWRVLLTFGFLLVSIFYFILDIYVMKSLVLDSSISFETYKVLDLSFFTFLGFLTLALLYISYTLLIDKLFVVLSNLGYKTHAVLFLILQTGIIGMLWGLNVFLYVNLSSFVLYSITTLLLFYFRFYGPVEFRFSNFMAFVVIFSVFTLIEVTHYSNLRHKDDMKRLAVSLSAEHDPIAELLFVDISKRFRQDEEIESILYSPLFDFDYLYSTVERKYFSGFLDKYDMQITLCSPEDSVYISPPDDSWYPCYDFFSNEILMDGMQVPGTDFFYLDNLNGRISYFYFRRYYDNTNGEVTLFIELDSRLFAESLGYPGLLLEDSYNQPRDNYSYAKYNHGRLITSSGEFSYSIGSDVYVGQGEGFEFFRFDNFDHIAYHLDSENIIIVSKPSLFWVDILISFSYVFGFYFLVLLVLLAVSRISPISMRLRFNFKNKIQFSITSVLLISFILFGAGTVYFSIKQYKERQLEILEEKVQSVYIELIHKLEYETNLQSWSSDSYYNLDELLQKFSNVFYTDINLFDSGGQLLATSRSEVYNTGLIGRRMNAGAYRELTVNKRSEYVHSERIGKLDYLSVYVPFMNANNQMLAFLNLPYFTRQDELTREIANIVVAIVNIVMLLSILSFTIAVFVSNKVTAPLRMLQQKIARITLSEKNEKIEYSGRDEIASLVKEYNQMVDQLHYSAELLAKSEREFAWREMAKQIAHEIKNPLTPMKLSVQHLKKAYREKGENMDEKVEKITKMLIEQIDDLSSIATEFSSFAKMPQAKNEKIQLARKIRDAIELFSDYEKCVISLKNKNRDELYVYADREQLSRVFINLIKNAIQSIPDNRSGRIEITMDRKDDNVLISVKDNGKGIQDDIRERMFEPNFTTKSSGMGLGLSIVKNIIENAGGRIYFESVVNEGTVFYIELPMVEGD